MYANWYFILLTYKGIAGFIGLVSWSLWPDNLSGLWQYDCVTESKFNTVPLSNHSVASADMSISV